MENYARSLSVIVALVLAGASLTFSGSAQLPDPNEELPDSVDVPFTPVTTAYSEDFAEDGGGFTASGTAAWEWGTPTSPPDVLEGQTGSMWGTHLASDYDGNECSFLTSPAIDLSGIPLGMAMLNFEHWIHAEMSSFSGNAWDGGIVMLSSDGENFTVADPTGGYPSEGSFTSVRNCFGVDSDQGVYSTARTPGPDADAWESGEVDVSEFLGGDLYVRFGFASDGFLEARGWYLDELAVQVGVGASIDVPELPIPEDPVHELPEPQELFPEPDPATGWAIGGEDPSWEYGEVTDSSSNVNDFRGEVGYMTNLDGETNQPECSYIQTPVMTGEQLALNSTLSFEHAYRIPGAFVNVAWGGGLVMVSTDLGITWEYLDLPEYDRPLDYSGGNPECFTQYGAPLDGNVFSGVNTDLHTVEADLSEYVGSPTIMVRFLFGTVTFSYEGWFINEVHLGGEQILD